MKRSFSFRKLIPFFFILFTFVIIGSSFKVMVLVKGFTEVRPVNAIPVPAGLCFGGAAGLACAFGNLIADVFGTLTLSSILGFIANFLAAYMPYKMWYAYYDESPNVHTKRKLVVYCWISFVASLSAAWIIGTGLWLIFGLWIPNICKYVFLNDLIFPILFGLPVFIVATSDSVKVECAARPKDRIRFSPGVRRNLILLYAVIVSAIVLLTHFGNPDMKLLTAVLSVPGVILTILLMI